MAVVNTNVNATVAQNALVRNERANEHRHGALVYRPAYQWCKR